MSKIFCMSVDVLMYLFRRPRHCGYDIRRYCSCTITALKYLGFLRNFCWGHMAWNNGATTESAYLRYTSRHAIL